MMISRRRATRFAASAGLTFGADLAEANLNEPERRIVEMSYSKIERSGWKDFFDVFTKAIEGRLLELEIVGRDIGDQRYGVGLNLNGITYDPTDGALYISISNATRLHIDHVVRSPREIHVEINEGGFSGLMVTDPEGHQQFMWLREPLALPVATMEKLSS
jgi:hypothetical protein